MTQPREILISSTKFCVCVRPSQRTMCSQKPTPPQSFLRIEAREKERVCQRSRDGERDRDICKTREDCDFNSTHTAALKHVNEATAFRQVLFLKGKKSVQPSFCTRWCIDSLYFLHACIYIFTLSLSLSFSLSPCSFCCGARRGSTRRNSCIRFFCGCACRCSPRCKSCTGLFLIAAVPADTRPATTLALPSCVAVLADAPAETTLAGASLRLCSQSPRQKS